MKLWLKLICFKFKDTVRVRESMQLWQRCMMEGTLWKGKLITRSVAKFLGESSGQGECVLKHMVVWTCGVCSLWLVNFDEYGMLYSSSLC